MPTRPPRLGPGKPGPHKPEAPREPARRPELDRLHRMVERDPRLKEALDFAKSVADTSTSEDRSSSRKIRRPYVSTPTLPERERKS